MECIWPEGHADCLQPVLHCMKELLQGILGEVANCSLCNSILEVGIDPTEGELLAALLACGDKCIVCKLAIITMVVLDLHSMLGCKLLKGLFCSNGFFRIERRHQMHILEVQEVVDENRGIAVVLLGECPLVLAKEASLGGDELVN